jgi:hypothetical protein
MAGRTLLEGVLVDWVRTQPAAEPRLPVAWLSKEQKAAELQRIQRSRAMTTAREAELILGLAADCPEDMDLPPDAPGAGRSWHHTEPEFTGVSEFFPDEVAHAINLGRGTGAFRARRAFTWREQLPATFAALRHGELDEPRAAALADVLKHARPGLAAAVEARLLPEAVVLSVSKLKRRALELLLELDADAAQRRHEEATNDADVFVEPGADGMATIGADLPADEAAEAFNVIDELARMAKADGDPRPIRQIRIELYSLLLRRPGGHGLPGVHTKLTVHASLGALEGSSPEPGDVEGFAITPAHLRDLLRRVGLLGLAETAAADVVFALTDDEGRLIATATPAELERAVARGEGLDPPPATESYTPTARQRRQITTRDRTCRMPNCAQRVGWADHDHVVAHSAGGRTTCTNLCCLCRHHHRLKTHVRGWTFRMDPDGTLHVTSPAGITRTTRPADLRPRPPEPPPPPPDPEPDPPPFSYGDCPF